jgi:DNA-binding transcriptional LysR family regulator
MLFSMEQLEAFIASAEAGSFSAGARKLGKAQSVVSTAIANLELDLNVALFDRSARSPVLTGHGQALLAQAKRILDDCGLLLATADEFQAGVEQKISLVVESIAMTQIMADKLKQFELLYPQVEMEILSVGAGDVLKLLTEGRAQLAVLIQVEEIPAGIEFFSIGTLEISCIAAASHPLASLEIVSWQALQRHRQIVLAGRYANEQHRWKLADSIWTTENAISAMQLVSSGIGWSALPLEMVREVIDSGTLTKLPLEFESQPWRQGVDLAWSTQQALGPAARALLQLLKEIKL